MNLSYKKISEKKNYLPFYVYDYEIIKGQILRLKKYLPENVKFFYSVKANPNVAILKIMKNFGIGAEIISTGELLFCQRAGINQKEMIFGGTIKTDKDLQSAVCAGMGLISVESISEIRRLNSIARSVNRKQSILMRLSPGGVKGDVFQQNFNELKNFKSVLHYGIFFRDVEKILNNFSKNYPNLDLRGLHIYWLNKIFDTDLFVEMINFFFSVVRNLEKKFKLTFKTINLGGGFHATISRQVDLKNFGLKLSQLIDDYNFNRREIVIELGRYFTNPAGAFITQVVEVDKDRNGQCLVVGGLVNNLFKPIGRLETTNRVGANMEDFKIEILPRRHGKLVSTLIRGQTSSFNDIFGLNLDCRFYLPKSRPGDLIMINGVGAYGLSYAFSLFGSRPIAAEFLLVNNKLELIKNKVDPNFLLRHQRVPACLIGKNK